MLVQGNIWEIYQHLQWMNGRNYFFLERTSEVDVFNLQIRWMFRPSTPNMAMLIGAIRLLEEGNNTRILFIVLASGEKMITEPFQKFFETVRDYFEGTVISENEAQTVNGETPNLSSAINIGGNVNNSPVILGNNNIIHLNSPSQEDKRNQIHNFHPS